jgi:hypothetical protein
VFCATTTFAFVFVVAGMGNLLLAVPLALITVAFIGYGIPWVRRTVRDMVAEARAKVTHTSTPARSQVHSRN